MYWHVQHNYIRAVALFISKPYPSTFYNFYFFCVFDGILMFFSFIVEEWGSCSSPCGEGIRERKVQCKIFLEFSKTIAVLPDHECPGPKPALTEICFSGLCEAGAGFDTLTPPITAPLTSFNNVQGDEDKSPDTGPHRLDQTDSYNMIMDEKAHRWKDVGYTACSESCLGGLQESKIICVNKRDNPASPMNCDLSERPEVIVRTCNDHPCPPRWNVSDFSGCSKSCGGGIQTRSVTCIQEVRHGGNNILRVDDTFCPQPPPITQQFCNVIDCPVKWSTGSWSKVSSCFIMKTAVPPRPSLKSNFYPRASKSLSLTESIF